LANAMDFGKNSPAPTMSDVFKKFRRFVLGVISDPFFK
jgi:hypothetical protein